MAAELTTLRTHEFHRILLIKLSAVGDVIHTIPVLNRLRRRYPSARIDWLLKPAIAQLIHCHPAVSSVVLYMRDESLKPLRSGWAAFADGTRLLSQLRSARYDLVIDLHGQLRTAVLTLATGAPVRIGFDRPRARVWSASARKFPAAARKHAWQGAREGSWLAYTHHIRIPTLDLHAVDRYLRVSSILGLEEDGVDFSFAVSEASVSRAEQLLFQHDAGGPRLAVIAPGSVWETKHWHSRGFARVAQHLIHQDFSVVLVGSRAERAICDAIVTAVPEAVNLAGETTLGALAAIMRRATICVTNDSGPMHLAVALDRPVVSIFGPTDALWIGPYGRPGAVVSAQPDCSPCYLRRLTQCPHGHGCMRNVSPEAVIERIETTLASKRDFVRAKPIRA